MVAVSQTRAGQVNIGPQAEKHRAWRRVQSVSLRSIGSIDPDPDSIPIVGTSWMLIVHGIITWYNGL